MEFNQSRVSRNVTLIDEGTIEKIAKTRVFDKDELNNKLYQFHKNIIKNAPKLGLFYKCSVARKERYE